MKFVESRFTVRPDKVPIVTRAINEYVQAMRVREPDSFCLVFREGATSTFVQLMSFRSPAAERRHARSAHVDHFVKRIYPHCMGRPTFTELDPLALNRHSWRSMNLPVHNN